VKEVKDDITLAKRTAEEIQRWAEQMNFKLSDAARFNGLLWLHDEGVKSAFLQDSDSLVLKTEPLVEILKSFNLFTTVALQTLNLLAISLVVKSFFQ